MGDSIQVEIRVRQQAQKDLLVAALMDLDLSGVEEFPDFIRVFFAEENFNRDAIITIAEDHGVEAMITRVPVQNWNAQWEAGFQPVTIGNFCAVRAHFHPSVPGVMHDLVITPKMSFGTGHHATTWLMIDAMSTLSFEHRTVFDFGTGTGILAILAEKLGAAAVFATDNDPWSIENAVENAAGNDCQRVSFELREGSGQLPVFNIILANINRNVLVMNLPALRQHLANDGVCLISGLLFDDASDIRIVAEQSGFTCSGLTEKEGWICMKLEV